MSDQSYQSNQISYGDYSAVAGPGGTAVVNVNQVPPPRLPPLQRPFRAENFINREAELAQLLADLQPGRVITLCGPGGIGKTSLAAEAIWTLAPGDDPPDVFPDGIIFHNFYNQPQVALALENIALTFGEEPRPTPRDAAQRVLAGRRVLVLLDGAEEADNLTEILAVLGGCGVLVTSRRRSDALAARQDIQPLPIDESVKLLQAWAGDRAANEAIAREICGLVGNLPLAVRLVGRYLNQTEEEAADYLAWLEESPLQALVDHGQRQHESVPLLLERSLIKVSAEAQRILTVIGLLAIAPFSQEIVIVALDKPATDVRRALGELVNYAFLVKDDERYLVSHALIHTYARERLTSEPEILTNLTNFYGVFAQEQQKAGAEGYARLDVERAHILQVLNGCAMVEAWDMVERLAWTIDTYLNIRGYQFERIQTVEMSLKAARALGHRQNEAAFLGNLGMAYCDFGQVEQAIECHQQALEIHREMGDRLGAGSDYGNLAIVYRYLGQATQAIEYCNKALEIAQEINEIKIAGEALNILGMINHDQGQLEEAIKYYHQALTVAQKTGDARAESEQLGNLGVAFYDSGQFAQAIDYHQAALDIHRRIGDKRGEGKDLGNLGMAYFELSQVEKAIKHYEESLAIAREIGSRRGEGYRLGNLGVAYRKLGQAEKAIEYYLQALNINQQVGDRKAEAGNLYNLGELYKDQGNVSQARQYLEQALFVSQEINSPVAKNSRRLLAELEEVNNDRPGAS